MEKIFKELDQAITDENIEREESGAQKLTHAQIDIMGQYCLLLNVKVQAILDLNLTNDVDAVLKADYFVKNRFAEILKRQGLELDSDSSFIWLPPDSRFQEIYSGANLQVRILDAESALLSKAIKAPEKNRLLVAEALLSGEFKKLEERIKNEGGDLDYFLEIDGE